MIIILLTIIFISFLHAPGYAQPVVVVVQSGDTLWKIAEKHLGNANLWQTIADYNNLKNPDMIAPSSEIKIPKLSVVRVGAAFGDVRVKRAETSKYVKLNEGERLYPYDEIAVGTSSRMQIELEDMGRLQIKPNTRVLLKESFFREETEVLKTRLQLFDGRVFFELPQNEKGKTDFEIETPGVLCGVRGTQFQTEYSGDEAMSRASVFEGRVMALAAGSDVAIPAGYGSCIANGQAPSQPTPLPAAPVLIEPEDGYVTGAAILTPGWQTVPEAVSYHLEISRDEGFNDVVREARIATNSLTVSNLTYGRYYWRISSIDTLGLEGRFSQMRTLSIVKKLNVSLIPSEPLYEKEGIQYARASCRYRLQPDGTNSGVVRILADQGTGKFEEYRLPLCFDEGSHTLRYKGVDASGSFGETGTFTVVVDAHPPQITIEAKGLKMMANDACILPSGKCCLMTLTAADPAGIEKLLFSIDGQEMVKYEKPFWLDGKKAHRVKCLAQDRVGNCQEKTFCLAAANDHTLLIFFLASLLGVWH